MVFRRRYRPPNEDSCRTINAEARLARGISLRIRRKVGIHFSHLSKIENGKDHIGRDSLLAVAEELGVDPDLLLGEAGHQAVPPFVSSEPSRLVSQLKRSKTSKPLT